jgi:hypothetical protein
MRIPVVWIGGQWKLRVIAPIQFNEGAVGELFVDSAGLADRTLVAAANERRRIAVLPVGTELRVALTIEAALDDSLRQVVVAGETPHDVTAKISNRASFVSVRLMGNSKPDLCCGSEPAGLWFVFRGQELPRIGSGVVELPKVRNLEARVDSLNQAFTRLSEVFEPWRKAHTGSIYERVFYKESDKRWGPLDELRNRAIEERWRASRPYAVEAGSSTE